MRALVLGFHWQTSPHVLLPEIMGCLIDDRGKLTKMGRADRLLAIHEGKEAYYGIILTPKDRKTQTILEKNAAGKFSTVLEHFKANQQRAEFNFFYVRKKQRNGTHNGLYLAAAESCGSVTFCRHVKHVSDKAGDQLFALERDKGKVKRGETKERRQEYLFRFEFRMSQKSWDALLKQVRSLKALTYQVAKPKIAKNFGTPPQGIAFERVTISFDQKITPDDGFIAWVRGLLKKEEPSKLDAKIEFDTDHFETIHLLEANEEKCGSLELDELSSLVEMKDIFEDFGKSSIIKKLDDLAASNAQWL